MRRWLLVLALAPGLALAGPKPLDHRVGGAIEALASEDVDAAREILEPLLAAEPDDPSVQLAGGILRFHEQRYDEAIALMEASGLGDPSGYLALSKAAKAVTAGDERVESEHFVITHSKGKDAVLVPYLTEALEKQRAVLEQALGYVPKGRFTVELLDTPSELAKVSTLTDEEIRTSGTVAVCKFNKLMILSPKALLKGYDWLDTAAHEYTHLVLTRKSQNRAPIWLQEGLAKWFEDDWRGGGEPVSPFSAALVREAVQKNKLVTFEEMHPSLAKLPSQERAALAYAQVAMAVEYMAKQRGPAALRRILELLGEGRRTESSVSEAMGMPFDRFLAEWKKYMAARPLPRGGDHELERLRFRDDPKHGGDWSEWAELGDERARGWARLGELFRERGRWTAARLEFQKAYQKVGPRVPILANQYALAAMMSGSKAEAEKVLAEALEWSPDYPALNVRIAKLLLDRGEASRARDHLVQANRQDPFDPEIHAGLAKALEKLGDPAGASREAGFARILSAGAHP